MALPIKNKSNTSIGAGDFVMQANKKPTTSKNKNVTFYLPIDFDAEISAFANENNVSRAIILMAAMTAFKNVDVNEQNRLLFEAIKNK